MQLTFSAIPEPTIQFSIPGLSSKSVAADYVFPLVTVIAVYVGTFWCLRA